MVIFLRESMNGTVSPKALQAMGTRTLQFPKT
jgi:hypothetical protein